MSDKPMTNLTNTVPKARVNGAIGGTAQKSGGLFSNEGVIGKLFTTEGSIGITVTTWEDRRKHELTVWYRNQYRLQKLPGVAATDNLSLHP
ncbi:hypothetical protein FAGAP_11588 [Fusarium agapanthi]|uniref:Uncharacterized protein n=1 Tax=Fusarium agapanthi TaxID=1803897 RepID=A0A9P5AYW5_9HYPO|nr:hypothetical protein FAGAP_11588 [Fusarium agapanthi]